MRMKFQIPEVPLSTLGGLVPSPPPCSSPEAKQSCAGEDDPAEAKTPAYSPEQKIDHNDDSDGNVDDDDAQEDADIEGKVEAACDPVEQEKRKLAAEMARRSIRAAAAQHRMIRARFDRFMEQLIELSPTRQTLLSERGTFADLAAYRRRRWRETQEERLRRQQQGDADDDDDEGDSVPEEIEVEEFDEDEEEDYGRFTEYKGGDEEDDDDDDDDDDNNNSGRFDLDNMEDSLTLFASTFESPTRRACWADGEGKDGQSEDDAETSTRRSR